MHTAIVVGHKGIIKTFAVLLSHNGYSIYKFKSTAKMLLRYTETAVRSNFLYKMSLGVDIEFYPLCFVIEIHFIFYQEKYVEKKYIYV